MIPRASRGRAWLLPVLAASVLMGAGIAVLLMRAPPQASPIDLPADAAALSRVLERTPSGVRATMDSAGRRYEVLPLASLQAESGRYCREFESSAGAGRPVRAAACRQPDGAWTVLAVGFTPPAGGATADTATVLGNARRLTPAEEAALLGAAWQAAGAAGGMQ